jgi:presenilin-like A22 family membrane protease
MIAIFTTATPIIDRMLRNQINPAVLFGLLLMGLALFLLSIGAQFWTEHLKSSRYNNSTWESNPDYYARIFFTLFGFVMVIVSLAFTLRATWARYFLLVLFYTAGLAYTVFLLYIWLDGIREIVWILVGLSAMVYGILLFCILFLSNEWVLRHWEKDYVGEERQRDILDL